jgi:5-hydroxyisourate hydrolase-like protein (transthyretin family)
VIILSTLRYEEEAYGSASQAILKKTRTHTQQRVKVSPQTIHDLSNGKYSVRGQSTNPYRNAGTQQRKNNYPDHHKSKTLLRRTEENGRICIQTYKT